PGPGPFPLVLTHGWPSSFLEYLALLPLLTDPAAHGGNPRDAFTVVLPSLPGFGFSGPPPPGGLVPAQVAELWHTVMTDVLGYRRFAAHRRHPRARGIALRPPAPSRPGAAVPPP